MRVEKTRSSFSWQPLAILAALLFLIYLLWDVLLVFILAAFFAFLVYPLIKIFDRKLPHIASIIAVYLIITILLIVVIGSLAPLVSQQSRQLVDSLPEYIEQVRKVVESLEESYVGLPVRWRPVVDNILTELQGAALHLTREAVPAAISFFGSFLTLLVFIPLLAFFILLDYTGYKRMLNAVVPETYRTTIDDLLSCMGRVLWRFIRGELILMIAVGLTVGLGLWAIGMPFAVVFGILAGILELIPNIGPVITTVLVGLIALAIDPVLALQAVGITVVVQLLENVFLVPLVLGKTVGLDPVTVVFSIFLGGSVAGIMGAIIAIPIAMMVKVVILYFNADDYDLQASVCKPGTRERKKRRKSKE